MRTPTRTLRIPVNPDEKTSNLLFETMKEYSKAAQMAYNEMMGFLIGFNLAITMAYAGVFDICTSSILIFVGLPIDQ